MLSMGLGLLNGDEARPNSDNIIDNDRINCCIKFNNIASFLGQNSSCMKYSSPYWINEKILSSYMIQINNNYTCIYEF